LIIGYCKVDLGAIGSLKDLLPKMNKLTKLDLSGFHGKLLDEVEDKGHTEEFLKGMTEALVLMLKNNDIPLKVLRLDSNNITTPYFEKLLRALNTKNHLKELYLRISFL